MRHLVLSYTRLISQVQRGILTEDNLENALFHFGCSREHVFRPTNKELEVACEDFHERALIYRKIIKAMLSAEAEGRVHYGAGQHENSYESLNAFLEMHDYPTVDFSVDPDSDGQYDHDTAVWVINKEIRTLTAL